MEPQRRELNRVSLTYPMDSMKRFAQDVYKRHDRAFALHSTNDEALESIMEFGLCRINDSACPAGQASMKLITQCS